MICGDFNYDLLKHEFNAYINEFINIMPFSFLPPCITKPTGTVCYNRLFLVDNTFVNVYDKTIFSENVLDKITDHLLNFIIIINLSLKPRIKMIQIRDMKNSDREKYFQDIKELNNLRMPISCLMLFKISLLRS